MEWGFEALTQWDKIIALATLVVLEIILGIDNILFISIVSEKLPEDQRPKARKIGLALALIFRIILLMGISWLVHFTDPLVTIPIPDVLNDLIDPEFSGRDLILLAGGIFLLVKTIKEIHHKVDMTDLEETVKRKPSSFAGVIGMILLVDLVFSIDSILTAVGMVQELIIMVVAIVVSMIVMLVFVNKISDFITKNPGIQMLALSFLILISFILILDGFGKHIERGYVYFALFFSLMVEILNIRQSKVNKHKLQAKDGIEK